MDRIRLATRRSLLAKRQAALVAQKIAHVLPGVSTEIVEMTTAGDAASCCLTPPGGKGLFTERLEASLRSGEADLAVHSAKDVPVTMAEDLCIAAVPAGEDPRDALVTKEGLGIEQLPAKARVGTGSVRRRVQLLALREDVQVVPLRGNLDTRVGKVLGQGRAEIDAAVVAMAGLKRSGLAEKHADRIRPLSVEQIVPAAGQGVLIVQTLLENQELRRRLQAIDDANARAALLAEREVVRALGADCHSGVGVHVRPTTAGSEGWAMVSDPPGGRIVRAHVQAPSAQETAHQLVRRLEQSGVTKLGH